ncbi:MAG: hypothetical protein ACO3ZY_10515 [Phycisphaerales bacterium]
MTSSDPPSRLAAEALRDALLAYRDAAKAWLEAVSDLGLSERQIADRLAIGRMILFRLRQFTNATDLVSMLDHLPGSRARGEIAETLLPNRLDADAVCADLIAATHRLDAAFHRHADTREQAIDLLASIDAPSRRRMLREERRTIFEGEARHRGLRAESLIGSVLVAPAADGRTCDVAALQLISGLQAHRPAPRAPIYMAMNGYADLRHDGFPVNLDPESDEPVLEHPERPSILRREAHTAYEFIRYVLRDDVPLHRPFDLGFGEIHPSMGPMEGAKAGDAAHFSLPVLFPVRHAVMELWLHRDLRRDATPPWPELMDNYRHTPVLGVDIGAIGLDRIGTFADATTPAIELESLTVFADLRRELLDRAATRLKRPLSEFEVHRLTEPHPPIESGLKIHWRLAIPGS